jgi:transposase
MGWTGHSTTRRARLNYTPAFNAKKAMPALKGDKPLAEFAQAIDVHPSQVVQWKGNPPDFGGGLA